MNFPNNEGINEIEDDEHGTLNDQMMLTREKIDKQDEMLEQLHNVLTITKKTNQEINSEIQNQKVLLENLDNNMEKVNINMKNTTNKIKKYDEKASNCGLKMIIWIELFIMFYLLLFV